MPKAFVYVDAENPAEHATATAGVDEVLAEYGVRILVRASAEQMSALAAAGIEAEDAGDLDVIMLPGVVIDTRAGDPPAPPPGWRTAAASGQPVYWLVQFVGPPLPGWTDAVSAASTELDGPITQTTVLVRATQAQAGAIEALGKVQWVGRHEPLYAIDAELAGEPGPVPVADVGRLAKAAGGDGIDPNERVQLRISLFDAGALDDVVSAVEAEGGSVLQAAVDSIVCELARSAIRAVAVVPAVGHVSRFVAPVPMLQFARPITHVQEVVDLHGLDGEGEVVAVCDTGLDRGQDNAGLHADFMTLDGRNGRVTGYAMTAGLAAPLGPRLNPATGLPGWDDPNGHGTHVAGITAGNGASAPGRPQTGVAFNAHLVMQSVLDLTGGLGGIPANVNRLFGPVYETDGVRVHNNSWGTPSLANLGVYAFTPTARQVDEFVWRNPDIVIVFAAGNTGTDGAHNTGAGANGVVDLTNISPEAAFRNGIAVGGTENNRAAITLAWNVAWGTGARFPAAPLAADRVASNPAQMMAFSGRGPTTAASGSRIKPDVCAPGSSIFAPYSPISPTSNFWGVRPPGSPYVFMGGTSMAAPHVAGMCALVRQYLRRVHRHSDPENAQRRRRRPSAALIKALLVHGAQFVNGMYPPSPADNHGPLPSNHQGWGRVDLRRTLFSHPVGAVAGADPGWLPRRTIFVDDPARTLNGLPAANPNSRRQHRVRVRVADTSVPLRATLAWSDYPGPVGHAGALFNQLRLLVDRHNADGTVTTFAVAAPAGFQPAPPFADLRNNNVQQVDVAAPNLVAGEYTIRVEALNILSFPLRREEQDFALVVSGPVSHSDHRVPGTMAALPDLAFVDLHPNGPQALHDGLAPSPQRPPGNAGSPDVWASLEASADPARAVRRVEFGRRHNVYVRVRNLGFAAANGTRVQAYWADPTSAFAYPADWKADGFRVGGVTGNERSVDVPARGEVVVGPFEWDPPRGFAQVTLLARAVHPDDPVVAEGDLRWDNNLTRRDVEVQDNSTGVQGQPSAFDRFLFWVISGFGTPRELETQFAVAYQDIRDGSVKPLPAGVDVEILDYDPVSPDDVLARGRTATRMGASGAESVAHLTFSTRESGERGPDLFLHVRRPSGADFERFLERSFFSGGADHWSSRSQAAAAGGFYEEDFGGDRIGIPAPVQVVVRPAGILVDASFEHLSLFGEFEPLPSGIAVKIMDSKPGAPRPLLGTARTDEDGRITTVVPRTEGHEPSIYFLIERPSDDSSFPLVSYFSTHASWDSRPLQAEILAADGSVSTVPGHFQDWDDDRLVAAGSRLRFRLESPEIHLHLRFEYFDREAAAFRPVPPGTEVEVWEDVAGAGSPLSRATIGTDGRADLAVDRTDRPDLYARLVMRRRLDAGPDAVLRPVVTVRKAGSVVHFDTKGRTATDGTPGLFPDVQRRVPAAGGPLTFRIGTGAGDAVEEHAAPFALRTIGEAHDWLRLRSGGDWTGLFDLTVELFTSAAEGSRFDGAALTIRLNTGHTAIGATQPDHWSRAAIVHHYGHLVLEQLYPFPGRVGPSVPNHRGANAADERSRTVAFAEGFADYLAARHGPAPVQPDPGGRGWRGTDNDGADNSGEIVPVAVANVLWRLDAEVVASGHAAITDPVNQRRFQALIWNPLKSLLGDVARQVPLELYPAVQGAALQPGDLIPPHGIRHVRQLVRGIFEANGMVFTRGQITAAPTTPSAGVRRFRVAPADRSRLNVAGMGRIAAYRIQARLVGAGNQFADLEPVVPVTHADQRERIDVEVTEARETGALEAAGQYDWRVRAQDEFGAWDTFADDFTGNAGALANSNEQWQRNRLRCIRGPNAVP